MFDIYTSFVPSGILWITQAAKLQIRIVVNGTEFAQYSAVNLQMKSALRDCKRGSKTDGN
jgi:hypothetical protein